ncbi:four helix bundle protein [bacterium]|nr:four helix bundle protein [bacterium]
MPTNRVELEKRLISFAVEIIHLSEKLPATRAGIYLSDQIVRSGISSALNYGEAQSAESQKDFIHKLGIVLKELRETQIGLKIIVQSGMVSRETAIENILSQNDELIAIFYRSVQTAKSKNH